MGDEFKNFDAAVSVINTGGNLDIVDRLRAKAAVAGQYMCSMDSIVEIMREAAAKIEELRTELADERAGW